MNTMCYQLIAAMPPQTEAVHNELLIVWLRDAFSCPCTKNQL